MPVGPTGGLMDYLHMVQKICVVFYHFPEIIQGAVKI